MKIKPKHMNTFSDIRVYCKRIYSIKYILQKRFLLQNLRRLVVEKMFAPTVFKWPVYSIVTLTVTTSSLRTYLVNYIGSILHCSMPVEHQCTDDVTSCTFP